MSYLNRREFGWAALGAGWAAAAAEQISSTVHGVIIGVQSYSFRDRPLDAAIKAMADVGLGVTELWQEHVEPRGRKREEIRQWRLTVLLDQYRAVAKKFRDAGIDLYSYNYSFRDDFTDEEIERGFQMAQALGATCITASATVSVAKRVDPFAQKYKMRVGMHNHSNIKPNEFATPDDWAEAMKGRSSYIAMNLDIGHFTAAGFDPVKFLAEHHADIVTLHIKDRKKNQGENVPFGQGDTPIKEVLTLLRDKKLKIPANIEYEYEGADTLEEVKKCYAYCREALGA
ncbi:MAG: sugar phosphate isomerase/epimerase [Acidobacteria bacterium]|nr:sugar phosphate isomerase/epimerase [Acidobacteriota bacterium]